MVTETFKCNNDQVSSMLVTTGLAVVIPQGNAFGDDVNFGVGSGASSANAGDGGGRWTEYLG